MRTPLCVARAWRPANTVYSACCAGHKQRSFCTKALDTVGYTEYDKIPDVRDGLTREERIVLYVLHQTQQERGERNVPTAMLWGRVCEYFYISPNDLSEMLARLGARK